MTTSVDKIRKANTVTKLKSIVNSLYDENVVLKHYTERLKLDLRESREEAWKVHALQTTSSLSFWKKLKFTIQVIKTIF